MKRHGTVFVSGLWASGKTSCLKNLERELGEELRVWSIKNYEVFRPRRDSRSLRIDIDVLRQYYDFVYKSFHGVVEQVVHDGTVRILEVSPPLLARFLNLATWAFYLDTPMHKCAERLARREGWPLKRATRLIQLQWELTSELGPAFWRRVERVSDDQLLRRIRPLVDLRATPDERRIQ